MIFAKPFARARHVDESQLQMKENLMEKYKENHERLMDLLITGQPPAITNPFHELCNRFREEIFNTH